MQKNRIRQGFTIIEVIISIAIFSVLILLTVGILQSALFGSQQQFTALANIDNAQLVTSRFVNQMRNADVGADGSYQITTAGDYQLVFYSQLSSNSAVDKINYYLSGTTLYEGVTVPTGSPATYNPANQQINIVQNDVVNTTPIFTYYDGNYDGTTSPLSQPVNVNSIKFVKINLTILNRTQAQSQATFSVSAGATIRNLKDNLGS